MKNLTQSGKIFFANFLQKNSGPNLRKKRVKNIEVSKTSKKGNTILMDIKLYPKFKVDINAGIA
ncbi:hypothetical protein [Fibrobacter succinogenes]|uniref:hypothetical protein n=1 Tax=Fibrobacter succinogenes TaxID=833 RepID=UPI00156904CD|nr:hypothetical protein [Fibrobacter succinogenes]